MKKNNEEFSIKELVDLFLPKIWIILIVSVVCSIALGGHSAFIKDDTYTSSAKLMVVKSQSQINAGDMDLTAQLIDTYKILLSTDNFLSYVVEDIEKNPNYINKGWNITKGYISSSMSVSALSNDVFKVSIKTDDAEKSFAIADSVSKMVEDHSSKILAYPENTVSAKTMDYAEVGKLDSKNTMRNAVIGFIGGAGVTMACIFVFSLFDVVIRDKKRLEETYDIPVLGVIPSFEIEEEKK